MLRQVALLLFCLALASSAAGQNASSTPTLTFIGYPGAVITMPEDINNKGQIVGYYFPFGGYVQGFLYDAGTNQYVSFRVSGATTSTYGFGINDTGLVVGSFEENGNSNSHGFRRTANGRFHEFIYPNHPAQQDAIDINNFGDILGNDGSEGYLYVAGTFTDIIYPFSDETVPMKMNDTLAIVGWYLDPTLVQRGMLYENGVYTEVVIPGSLLLHVDGINNLGDMVGVYEDSTGLYHGFLLKQGVLENIDCAGSMEYTEITAINDSEIFTGYCGPYDSSSTQAFFGTP